MLKTVLKTHTAPWNDKMYKLDYHDKLRDCSIEFCLNLNTVEPW